MVSQTGGSRTPELAELTGITSRWTSLPSPSCPSSGFDKEMVHEHGIHAYLEEIFPHESNIGVLRRNPCELPRLTEKLVYNLCTSVVLNLKNMKSILLLGFLSALLKVGSSSPVEFSSDNQIKRAPTDITDVINGFLQSQLDGMDPIITLTDYAEIPILFQNIFNVTLVVHTVTLEGLKGLTARDCTYEVVSGKFNMDMTFHIPILTLAAEHYTMDGMVVDTIHLVGDGTMSLIPEDFSIRLTGTAIGTISPIAITFESAAIDIEMWRWTVDFQGLMPGSDLGTVFNEFFTMVGPELMDLLEIRINDGDWLLDFINGIFGGGGGAEALLSKHGQK
ncbi:hypothetical protein SK128_013122 [Halocaridina rubra]|uniref:Uncharacterized protein n=1 Tax=Halocaridina rubra TaxID=373956 RepID=A0AAN9A7M8_HALRR